MRRRFFTIKAFNTPTRPPKSSPPELRELDPEGGAPDDRSLSTRLITGVAAEKYFVAGYTGLPDFAGHPLRDVTSFG